jgi:hypothetical protein
MGAPLAIVGLSGGVVSAVAAWRLQVDGYRVSIVFMVNWTEDEQGYCTSAQDFQSARAVADELKIPLHRVDGSAEYRERVFRHFLDDYAAGRTPNPDLLCNREVKFQPFREHALRPGLEVAHVDRFRIRKTFRTPLFSRQRGEIRIVVGKSFRNEIEHKRRMHAVLGNGISPVAEIGSDGRPDRHRGFRFSIYSF